MKKNFYSINRQKLLFMVEELHKRGFGTLRIIPSLAPSGLHWRCSFIDELKKNDLISSTWIAGKENENTKEEIKLTIQELADLFVKENLEFINHCKGHNEEYTKWYSEMLKQLKEDELPYAFGDYEMPKGAWRTTKGNEIATLPNHETYYF